VRRDDNLPVKHVDKLRRLLGVVLVGRRHFGRKEG